MSARIDFRNKLIEQLHKLADFSPANVQLYKMDRVDKTPFAAVYLQGMTSRPEAMDSMDCQDVRRELRAVVDFYLDTDAGDADALLSAYLDELEGHIMTAAKNGEFPDRDVMLESARFHPTETSRERRGDLETIWVIEYDEAIATA